MTPREPTESEIEKKLQSDVLFLGGSGRRRLNAAAFAAAMLSTEPYPHTEKPKQSKRHEKIKHEPHPLTLEQRKKILKKKTARGKK